MIEAILENRRLRLVAVLAVALALTGARGIAWAEQPVLQANPHTHTAPFNALSVSGDAPSAAPAGGGQLAAPPSFSLVPDYVTPVKNQGPCGSCWTFATYGSMESCLLKSMPGAPPADLSENHLKNYHGFDPGPCDGGNSYMSTAYLSRLAGPVSEADDPYHPWDDRPSPGGTRQYFLRRSLWYDTDAEVKNALMTKGALYTAFYWNDAYYNAAQCTYRYTGSSAGNHAVTIVGWDDARSVPGATAPGAWLIKNSWGPAWGQQGYFWLSYEDTYAGWGVSFEAEDANVVRRTYCHDYFGDVTEVNCPYGMNAFRTTEAEWLKAVGFYVQQDNASYLVSIYDTMVGGKPSGLLASKSGVLNAGFHVVDLDRLVALAENDDFLVSLYISGGGPYPLAIDFQYPGYSTASTASAGESYYSFDGVNWTDLWTWDHTANFAIKAYTVPEPATLFLAAAGLAYLAGAARRQRRNSARL